MRKDIRFNALVKQASRNADDSKWRLDILVDGQPQVEEYDKVVLPQLPDAREHGRL